ncbi:hypothetical protein [Micromonospora echinofusca]|uniref:Secreted protein n=1 Tax=Micromonospora echinofusca TaxID=47858 RepID=A0ABS3VYE2_MICEH|nr:hypothetical protein [Micromonospora echinofusca]MBO4209389.1 hypothetical protein [Micromonospora echinofusca]
MTADVPTAAPTTTDPGTIRLALIVGGLVVALVAGFAVGRFAVGSASTPAGGVPAGALAEHSHSPGTGAHDHGPGTPDDTVGGLALSEAGYTLTAEQTTFAVDRPQELRFQIRDATRRAVTGFAVVHEKPMHLIVVRRDLTGYQHLHPTMSTDGTWRVPLTLTAAGSWRAYADFTALDAAGRQTPVTLGVDLLAAGDHAPRTLPPATRTATVDGFTVGYEGTPQIGASAPLLFRISADGAPVTGIERYLGAYGHLVAIREGDLGYLHVHPEPALVDGAVKFWLSVPSPGRYRLFFDFQVGGVVRTAEFTLTAG